MSFKETQAVSTHVDFWLLKESTIRSLRAETWRCDFTQIHVWDWKKSDSKRRVENWNVGYFWQLALPLITSISYCPILDTRISKDRSLEWLKADTQKLWSSQKDPSSCLSDSEDHGSLHGSMFAHRNQSVTEVFSGPVETVISHNTNARHSSFCSGKTTLGARRAIRLDALFTV